MDSLLHDHCYTNLFLRNQPDGTKLKPVSPSDSKGIQEKHRSPPPENDLSNPLINGISEAYTNPPKPLDHSTTTLHVPNTDASRAISLLDTPFNGYKNNVKFVSGKQPNKIHELLFGDEESKYVSGVQIPESQTVSEDSKSITTSDFGYYINNPTTYNSVSAMESSTVPVASERNTIFGSSMSADSETEILEAASALMDLARNCLHLNTKKARQHRAKKLKKEKTKPKPTKFLKIKPDVKTQKRKYTKRNKVVKRETVKATYSLWSNGHKYDEFEYYATKPMQRASSVSHSRKSSTRSQPDLQVFDFEGQDSGEASTSNKAPNESETNVPKFHDKRKRRYSQRMEGGNPEQNDDVGSISKAKVTGKGKHSPKRENNTDSSPGKDIHKSPGKKTPAFSKSPSTPGKSESSSDQRTPEKMLIELKAEHEEAMKTDSEEEEELALAVAKKAKAGSNIDNPGALIAKPFNKGRRKSREYVSDDDDGSDVEYKPITYVKCSDVAAQGDPWGQALPQNILLKIFQIVVEEDGVAPFLARAAKTCKLWYTVAADKSLWRTANLSGNVVRKFKKNFRWLVRYRLPPVRFLSLANWEILTYKELELLGKHCPLVESINLSRCSRVTPSSLKTLIDCQQHLKHVDLSFATTFIASRFVLEHLVEKRGEQLETLNCSFNILVKFDVVLDAIMLRCRNLQVLDLSNAIFSSCLLPIRIEKLQAGCPRLRKLIMANSLFKVKPEELLGCPGFDDLEVLNVARSAVSHLSKFKYVNDTVLHRFLRSSSKLKALDVSGCRHITNMGLQNLATPNLESLSLSYCRASAQPEIKVTILRWSHSLRELDFSGNSVDPDLIRAILTHCEKLTSLNLSACRGLPWDKRREFSGAELNQLRSTINDWI